MFNILIKAEPAAVKSILPARVDVKTTYEDGWTMLAVDDDVVGDWVLQHLVKEWAAGSISYPPKVFIHFHPECQVDVVIEEDDGDY